jgi:hypothetical protein
MVGTNKILSSTTGKFGLLNMGRGGANAIVPTTFYFCNEKVTLLEGWPLLRSTI